MNEIRKMEDLIEELSHLLDGFDLDEHNDEANPDLIERAKRGLADVEFAVGDLIP